MKPAFLSVGFAVGRLMRFVVLSEMVAEAALTTRTYRKCRSTLSVDTPPNTRILANLALAYARNSSNGQHDVFLAHE